MKHFDVIIVGGGAAGFFAAINIAQQNVRLKVALLEKGKQGLQKVKVSGGGRCNVTHAEFVPWELVLNYPRGEKELLGPFHHFMTGDTIAWFENRGVPLKIEEDGRMFPESNSSQTIIDCFLNEAEKSGVQMLYGHALKSLQKERGFWKIETSNANFSAEKIIMATGSSPKIWSLLEALGHHIIEPVPSLFTFDIADERINGIPGVVVNNVEVEVLNSNLSSEGPLLITHVGMSAPAILKLSAFGALELARSDYKFEIKINFIKMGLEDCVAQLKRFKQSLSKRTVYKFAQFELPKRIWRKLVLASGIPQDFRWADIDKSQIIQLAEQLTQAVFSVTGKSTFKEEFVTAGGVDLKEINFKTFESKVCENLFFAGEILNIDAITGGFNFQNAWSSAYIAAQHISASQFEYEGEDAL
ncbi:NAD(P)/FAD-dependent oxidoreductase [Sediminibacter sp. Hel_I_10]|uniref:NAD(P)/FAD-dependent oxidoreductase n=1 Tax=Sediminibacter sp. Hel_I_10 TaxID=1392490 RepID=UPI00047EA0FD|nr:NAD(P)/FAD-dependent oxidoreductase [Sediminibacter sp. Hel_I_10]